MWGRNMAEHLSGYVQYYENYSPVGDLTVMAICFVFFILMRFSYNIKTRNYRLLQLMVASLLVASAADVAYHMVTSNVETVPVIFIYLLRSVFHAGSRAAKTGKEISLPESCGGVRKMVYSEYKSSEAEERRIQP